MKKKKTILKKKIFSFKIPQTVAGNFDLFFVYDKTKQKKKFENKIYF